MTAPLTPRNAQGNPVFAPTFFSISEHWRGKGHRFTATGNTATIHDYEVTVEILVQGASFWVRNANDGDYAHFSVVDKTDVLGYHTAYGVPIGTPIELIKYQDAFPLPPGDFDGAVMPPTVAPVASGLFMRITYHATGANDVKIGINYNLYEGAA